MRGTWLGWMLICVLACTDGPDGDAGTASGSGGETSTATDTAATGTTASTTKDASTTGDTGGTASTGVATDTADTDPGCGSGTPWAAGEPGPFVISFDAGGELLPFPGRPRPSGDGRFVLFTTGEFAQGGLRMWLLDNKCGTVEALPLPDFDPIALQADLDDLELSRDGSTVVFTARGPESGQLRAYALDVASGELEALDVLPDGTEAVGVADHVSVSADGRFVAFTTDLPVVAGDDGIGVFDIVVRDREAGVTELISVDSEGKKSSNHCYSPSISDDGRFVAFEAFASSLSPEYWSNGTHAYVRDREAGLLELASPQPPGLQNGTSTGWRPHISGDGRYVAFATDHGHLAEDADGESDVYLLDRESDQIALVSVATPAALGPTADNEPWVADGGQRLVYIATGLEAPYPYAALLTDRASGTTVQPDPGPDGDLVDLDLSDLRVSADGVWVVAIAGPTDPIDPPLAPGEWAIVMRRADAILGE